MVAIHMLLEGRLLRDLDAMSPSQWFNDLDAETARVWLRRRIQHLCLAHKDTSTGSATFTKQKPPPVGFFDEMLEGMCHWRTDTAMYRSKLEVSGWLGI